MKSRNLLLFALSLLLCVPGVASASSGYMSSFRTTYPAAVGSALDSCTLCHTSVPATNPYGSAYAANGHSYTAIAGLDSDGDGFTNGAEIAALTFPGNAASKPAPAPDATAPTVTGFVLPSTSTSLTVPITSLAATDNAGVTGFLVGESATSPAATATGWSAAPPTSFTFSAEGPRTLYAFARDAAGNVSAARSATVTITLPAPPPPVQDTVAPSIPSGLRVVSASSGSVALAWNASSDNVGATGYLVLRGGAQIGTATGTSFTDVTVTGSTSYSYTVQARDAAGNLSSPSVPLVVITPAAPAPSVAVSPASLSFAATVGGPNPAPSELTIANTGGGTLSWSVGTADAWLHASPASGTGAGTVTVAVDATGLVAGSYTSEVTISSAGADNSPRSVPVVLTIGAVDEIPSLRITGIRRDMRLRGTSTFLVTWETVGYEEAASARLYLLEGTDRTRIDTLEGNPGSYEWVVPPERGRFRIQVVLRDENRTILAVARSPRFSITSPDIDSDDHEEEHDD